jgi:hypothetical protein
MNGVTQTMLRGQIGELANLSGGHQIAGASLDLKEH